MSKELNEILAQAIISNDTKKEIIAESSEYGKIFKIKDIVFEDDDFTDYKFRCCSVEKQNYRIEMFFPQKNLISGTESVDVFYEDVTGGIYVESFESTPAESAGFFILESGFGDNDCLKTQLYCRLIDFMLPKLAEKKLITIDFLYLFFSCNFNERIILTIAQHSFIPLANGGYGNLKETLFLKNAGSKLAELISCSDYNVLFSGYDIVSTNVLKIENGVSYKQYFQSIQKTFYIREFAARSGAEVKSKAIPLFDIEQYLNPNFKFVHENDYRPIYIDNWAITFYLNNKSSDFFYGRSGFSKKDDTNWLAEFYLQLTLIKSDYIKKGYYSNTGWYRNMKRRPLDSILIYTDEGTFEQPENCFISQADSKKVKTNKIPMNKDVACKMLEKDTKTFGLFLEVFGIEVKS